MRRTLLTIALMLTLGISAFCQTTKVVTDSVTFKPTSVQIHKGVTKNGNPKWWIELPTANGVRKVTMTEAHATSDRLLALIERKDTESGKYYYSIKFAESRKRTTTSGKADLSALK